MGVQSCPGDASGTDMNSDDHDMNVNGGVYGVEDETSKLDFVPIPREKLCPVAILPGGTGNSTALTLGIDNFEAAIKNVLAGARRLFCRSSKR